MSSTSHTRTSSSTRSASLSAMTTPFVQPSLCGSLWKMKTTLVQTNGTKSHLTMLISNTADPNFSSCQPDGWNVNASRPFTFSPAVCPSDWVYYDLQQSVSHIPITEYNTYITTTFSMAYCCASGYTWTDLYAIPGLDYGCYKTFNESNPTTITQTIGQASTSQSLPLFTNGVITHQPYTVQWAASDTDTMTPSLPLLTHSMLVPTWKPGENIPAGKYDRYGSDSIAPSDGPSWQGLFYFLVIGVPLIGVTVLSCCIWCGCRARDKKWKKRMKQQEIELTARFANANVKEPRTTLGTGGDAEAS